MRKLIQLLIILIASVFIGWGLLTLAYLLPVEKMNSNMFSSTEVIVSEGYTPTSVTPYLSSRGDNGKRSLRRMLFNSWITLRDNFTDALMLGTASCSSNDSAAQKALLIYKYDEPPIEALNLIYDKTSPTTVPLNSYARYWHGYLIFLKPLLLFLNYSEIRLLNYLIELILLLFLFKEMYKLFDIKFVILFFSSMLFVSPYIIPLCLQYTTVFFPLLIGLIVLLRKHEWFLNNNRLIFYFLVIGIVTSYFDLLTYPLVTWGIPMLLVLAISSSSEVSFSKLCMFSSSWLFGYAGMWVGKWTLGSIVLKKNLFADGLENLIFRTSHVSPDKITPINIFYILGEHLYKYANIVYIALILLIFVPLVIAVYRNRKNIKWKTFLQNNWIYLLICLAPVVWYQIALNHSVHPYTFRILWIAVLSSIMFLYRLANFSYKVNTR